MDKIFVLDSTVFLEGQTAFASGKACATVYEVAEEMKSGQASIEFDKMVRLGLAVVEPGSEHVKSVEDAAAATNDKVSVADKMVVALALDFAGKGKKVAVVSDDYAVQNLCKHFGVEIVALSKKGIKRKFTWVKKCRACGKRVESFDDACPVCGSDVKFVPKH